MNKFTTERGSGTNEVMDLTDAGTNFVSFVAEGHHPTNTQHLPETVLITGDVTGLLLGADIRCILADVRAEYENCETVADAVATYEALKTRFPFIEDMAAKRGGR